MTVLLRQNTTQTELFGPFLDATDGVTAETGLASNATEITKDGAAFGTGPTLGTHDEDGWYPVAFTTTHTNTLGSFRLKSHDAAVHCPVWDDFMVVTAEYYDAVVLGTDNLTTDLTAGALTSINAEVDTGIADADLVRALATGTADSGSTTTLVDAALTEADTNYWKGSVLVITSGTIAGQARIITGFTPASDTVTVNRAFTQAVGTNTYEIWPLNPEVSDEVNTLALATASGLSDVETDTQDIQARLPSTLVGGRMDSDAVAISGSTTAADDVQANIGNLDAAVSLQALASICTEARLAELDAANLPTDIANVETDTQDIQARLPSALVGGRMDSDAVAISGSTTAADDVQANIGNLDATVATRATPAQVDTALSDINLDHLAKVAAVGADITDNSIFARMVSSAATADWDTFVNTSDSLQAIRDRGDVSWITGGGGGITDILNIVTRIPCDIDLAGTATYRIGLSLVNSLDDLPTTAEITPGTLSIDRKAPGGTTWSSVVSDSALSEDAGQVYFDEVFDAGTGYAEGDSLRFTFKSIKITVAANDYEVTDATGWIFYSSIRQTMRGTDSAALASVCTEARLAELDAANLPTDIANLQTTADAIETDTQDIQTRLPAALVTGRMSSDAVAISGSTTAADDVQANIANLDGTVSSRASQVTADAIETDTQDIQSRLPAALVTGRMSSDAVAISGSTTAADDVQANIGNLDGTVSSRASQVTADAIETDTQDIQTRLPAALVTGRMSSDAVAISGDTATADAVQTNIGNLDAAITTRATPAQVNTEVVDVLTVDAVTELASAPGATPSFRDMMNFVFMFVRNKRFATATLDTLRNFGDSADVATATTSDDTTTFTRNKWV